MESQEKTMIAGSPESQHRGLLASTAASRTGTGPEGMADKKTALWARWMALADWSIFGEEGFVAGNEMARTAYNWSALRYGGLVDWRIGALRAPLPRM